MDLALRLSTILLFVLISSCATIYTGNEYKPLDKKKLFKIDKTVTFRFLTIHKGKHYKTGKDNWVVNMNGSEYNPDCEYIKSLKLFKKIVCLDTKDGKLRSTSHESYEAFEKEYPPKYDTEYFIDLKVKRPFYYHGSGTGMYGLLLSAMTIGIIPSYWTYDGEYEIDIRTKEGKFVDTIEYEESYGKLSSTLFWLVPSSKYVSPNPQKSQMEKNRVDYYLEKITSKIKADG